jgi:hypothetical protein
VTWQKTWYFENVRPKKHPELTTDTIERVADNPTYEAVQEDGRLRRWAYVESLEHWIRVIIEPDGTTLHNAFIDSTFSPGHADRFGAEEV